LSQTTRLELEHQVLEVIQDRPQGVATKTVCARLKRTPQELGDAFESLANSNLIVGFGGLWLTVQSFQSFSDAFIEKLSLFHQLNPSVILAPSAEIAILAAWTLDPKPLDRMINRLASEGAIYKGEAGVRISEFRPVLPERPRTFLDRVKATLECEPINTPTPHAMSQTLHVPSIAVEEILKLGVETGEIAQLGETVYYTTGQLEALRLRLGELGEENLTASSVRDTFGTTRKYAVALLAHFYPRSHD
jgi:Elongation factor SelB, winged helix